jgi:carboxymethylenebutenolidase
MPPLSSMPRTVVIALALITASACAWGADMAVRELSVSSPGGDVRVRCYSAPGDGPLAVVVLLHGASGFAPFSRHYESYAEALVPHGFRICAVLYYSADDARIMADRDRSESGTLFQRRFMDWVSTIHGVVDRLSNLPTTERRAIGILGFSQGAYLAVAVAGTNRNVKALAEFYGGFPFSLESQITQLPATLIVHGESDTVIPVQEAHAMEAVARARATNYTIKLYPGAGHGFDVQADDPRALDARRQAVDFFVRNLKANPK